MERAKQARTNGVEVLCVRPAEAATMLGVSRSKIYSLINAGTIPCVKLGDSDLIRIPVAALRNIVDEAMTRVER